MQCVYKIGGVRGETPHTLIRKKSKKCLLKFGELLVPTGGLNWLGRKAGPVDSTLRPFHNYGFIKLEKRLYSKGYKCGMKTKAQVHRQVTNTRRRQLKRRVVTWPESAWSDSTPLLSRWAHTTRHLSPPKWDKGGGERPQRNSERVKNERTTVRLGSFRMAIRQDWKNK